MDDRVPLRLVIDDTDRSVDETVLRRGNHVEIITHPLWDTDPNHAGPQLGAACAQAVAAGCQVTMKSIFEVLRRPF